MHPYREMPVEALGDVADEGTQAAFAVLAVTGFIAMIALPLTRTGAFGGVCAYAGVDWLIRRTRR
jgi:hypothetical protein